MTDRCWLFEDLAIRAGGPLIDVTLCLLMSRGTVWCFGILLKSVPPLISYDVICVKTLYLNNCARF